MPAPDRKRRLTAFLVAMAVLVATPLAVVAADAFTDVPDTNVFHDDIAWLADAGVTKGCNPPDNTEFCPSNNVTREQMAAFMRRLAGYMGAEDGTPAQADNATTADSATTAGDANLLDGKDSSDFVQKGEADSVTSEMVANEAGAALASSDSGDIGATLGPIVSVTLTAPSSGFVLVNADMQLNLLHTSGGGVTQATLGFSTSETSFTQNHQDNAVGVPSVAPSGFYFHSPGLTSVFPVTAGEVTIHLLGEEDGGSVTYNDATLSAVFVPSSYGAVTIAGQSEDGEDPAD